MKEISTKDYDELGMRKRKETERKIQKKEVE